MNRKIATSLLVAVASANALADDITIDNTPFVSTKSRAEVRAELDSFKKAGVSPWSMAYNPLRTFKSGKTRADATAEYLASRQETAAITSEDSGSAFLTRMAARRSQQQYIAGHPDSGAQ